MQVILGSGGAIGIDLAKELKKFTGEIRLASRNPKKVNDNDELVMCDLTKPNEVVYKNLKAGKKANWFCSVNHLHNFTFTPDAAKATALLGNTESAFGQVWHLPTAAPITGKELIEKIAKEIGVEPKTQVASKSIVQFLGIFNPIMKEFVEMLYQWDRDYNFSSSKFETTFKMKPTSVDEAIKQMIKAG